VDVETGNIKGEEEQLCERGSQSCERGRQFPFSAALASGHVYFLSEHWMFLNAFCGLMSRVRHARPQSNGGNDGHKL